jgi:acetylornithine deacetylase/succinyl-diaminopimelate desuccinylase-like protein
VGGYTGAGKKSVIPAKVTAKFSCRLVPDQDPFEIAERIRAHVLARLPRTVTAELKQVAHSYPSVLSLGTPALIAAQRAYRQAFKADPVYLRGGGSLPIVRDFIDVLHAPVVLIGFGLPDDNVHAPNEKIHLPNLWRGIETVIHYFAEFAASAGKRSEQI